MEYARWACLYFTSAIPFLIRLRIKLRVSATPLLSVLTTDLHALAVILTRHAQPSRPQPKPLIVSDHRFYFILEKRRRFALGKLPRPWPKCHRQIAQQCGDQQRANASKAITFAPLGSVPDTATGPLAHLILCHTGMAAALETTWDLM